MQFLSAKPLIHKFRQNIYAESEIGPYFLAHMIAIAAIAIIDPGAQSSTDRLTALHAVIITILGINGLKKENGNSFGNLFVHKYFTLGWVVFVRLLLLSIPLFLGMMALISVFDYEHAADTLIAIASLVVQVIYYAWLAMLFREANQGKTSGRRASGRRASAK
ncbi:MAG: hypothetical protein Q7Q71_16310 [Verrucomicrobiota bacterium JB023]|nr:hypothetical protein [Verrucomicrobiota bacterium JB023]